MPAGLDFTSGIRMQMALPFGSGNTDRVGLPIAMNQNDSICFVFNLGVHAGVSTAKIQSGNEPDLSDAVDLVGALLVQQGGDDDVIKWVEIRKLEQLFARCIIDKNDVDVNAEGCVAFIWEGNKPVVQPGTGIFLLRPAQEAP